MPRSATEPNSSIVCFGRDRMYRKADTTNSVRRHAIHFSRGAIQHSLVAIVVVGTDVATADSIPMKRCLPTDEIRTETFRTLETQLWLLE